MAIKVLVNGAFGRMGQISVAAIEKNANLELVGQTGREYDLKKSIEDSEAEVVIDFTQPEVVYQNTLTIIKAGARPVIGTSGLTLAQIQNLQENCAELKRGGIIAANFSIGAILMMQLAQTIAKYMPYAEIIEMHHGAKVDHPSGTSLRSAELIASSNEHINAEKTNTHETIPHARGATYHGIPIHSVRLPGLLAHQQIIFGQTGETLTLKHDSIDRQCFMAGIALACEKVMALDRLIYGLEEIL